MQKTFSNNIYLGIITGILAPMIGLFIFYISNFSSTPLPEFLEVSISKNLLSPALALSAVMNLGLFYLYLKFDLLYSARGVILSTLICGLIIVVLKFVI